MTTHDYYLDVRDQTTYPEIVEAMFDNVQVKMRDLIGDTDSLRNSIVTVTVTHVGSNQFDISGYAFCGGDFTTLSETAYSITDTHYLFAKYDGTVTTSTNMYDVDGALIGVAGSGTFTYMYNKRYLDSGEYKQISNEIIVNNSPKTYYTTNHSIDYAGNLTMDVTGTIDITGTSMTIGGELTNDTTYYLNLDNVTNQPDKLNSTWYVNTSTQWAWLWNTGNSNVNDGDIIIATNLGAITHSSGYINKRVTIYLYNTVITITTHLINLPAPGSEEYENVSLVINGGKIICSTSDYYVTTGSNNSYVEYKDVYFYRASNSIKFSGGTYNKFINCRIIAVGAGTGWLQFDQTTEIKLEGCIIQYDEDTDSPTLSTFIFASGTTVYITDCVITHSVTSGGNHRNINLSGGTLFMSGCKFTMTTATALNPVLLYLPSSTVAYIHNNHFIATSYQFLFTESWTKGILSDNIIDSSATTIGGDIDAGSSCIVVGNILYDTTVDASAGVDANNLSL